MRIALTVSILLMSIVLSGCVSRMVRDKIYDHSDYYQSLKPVLSDEIVAFSFADAVQNDVEHRQALVLRGRKNVYTIIQGATDFEQIAKSGIDIRLLQADADVSHSLLIKGDQFWGSLRIGHKIAAFTFQTPPELEKLGFEPAEDKSSCEYRFSDLVGSKKSCNYHFVKYLSIGGTILPLNTAPPLHYTKLDTPQAFNLYDAGKAEPPTKWGAVALFPGAVVADAVLGIVELVGFFIMMLFMA